MSTEKSFWASAKSFFSLSAPVSFASVSAVSASDKRSDSKRLFTEQKLVGSVTSNSVFIDSFGSLNMP